MKRKLEQIDSTSTHTFTQITTQIQIGIKCKWVFSAKIFEINLHTSKKLSDARIQLESRNVNYSIGDGNTEEGKKFLFWNPKQQQKILISHEDSFNLGDILDKNNHLLILPQIFEDHQSLVTLWQNSTFVAIDLLKAELGCQTYPNRDFVEGALEYFFS